MLKRNSRPMLRIALIGMVIAGMTASQAYASGSGMPWEGPLEQVVDSITGPVARAAAVIAIIIAGIAIMFAAVSFFLDFFGFAGGAVL